MSDEMTSSEPLQSDTDDELVKQAELAEQGLELEEAIKAESVGEQNAESEGVEPSLEEKLAHAEARAAEYLDGWQRARAEFANARKRLERERAEAYRNAAVDYAEKLLPILDDFGRALDNVPDKVEQDSWYEGILLVQRKFLAILEGLQVEPIEAMGHPFDPNFHEALSLREADGVESGVVIEELQTGYRIGDRVIRPSLVNVSA